MAKKWLQKSCTQGATDTHCIAHSCTWSLSSCSDTIFQIYTLELVNKHGDKLHKYAEAICRCAAHMLVTDDACEASHMHALALTALQDG